MKNTLINKIVIAAVAATSLLGINLYASDLGSARGGATQQYAPSAPVVSAASVAPMGCARCTDKISTVSDTSAKGAQAQLAGCVPTKTVSTHQCGACGNKWTMNGVGKSAVASAVHTCGGCK